MVKQFLLNPDGSIPNGVNLQALIDADIPLVMPTPRWEPAEGMQLEERDPVQDENNVWRQVWAEVPAPVIEEVPEEPA